jgi:hypothetical protein
VKDFVQSFDRDSRIPMRLIKVLVAARLVEVVEAVGREISTIVAEGLIVKRR